MNAGDRLTLMTHTDPSCGTLWSDREVRDALRDFRNEVLWEAETALRNRAGELADLAEQEMRRGLEENAQEWHEAAATVGKLRGPAAGPAPEGAAQQPAELDRLRARVTELEQTTTQARADLADSHDHLAHALGQGNDAEWADLVALAAHAPRAQRLEEEARDLRARVVELEADLAAKAKDTEAAVKGWARARARLAEGPAGVAAERNCLAFAVLFARQWTPDAPVSLRDGLDEILATMPQQARKGTGNPVTSQAGAHFTADDIATATADVLALEAEFPTAGTVTGWSPAVEREIREAVARIAGGVEAFPDLTDAYVIGHARTLLPELLALVDRLAGEAACWCYDAIGHVRGCPKSLVWHDGTAYSAVVWHRDRHGDWWRPDLVEDGTLLLCCNGEGSNSLTPLADVVDEYGPLTPTDISSNVPRVKLPKDDPR